MLKYMWNIRRKLEVWLRFLCVSLTGWEKAGWQRKAELKRLDRRPRGKERRRTERRWPERGVLVCGAGCHLTVNVWVGGVWGTQVYVSTCDENSSWSQDLLSWQQLNKKILKQKQAGIQRVNLHPAFKFNVFFFFSFFPVIHIFLRDFWCHKARKRGCLRHLNLTMVGNQSAVWTNINLCLCRCFKIKAQLTGWPTSRSPDRTSSSLMSIRPSLRSM